VGHRQVEASIAVEVRGCDVERGGIRHVALVLGSDVVTNRRGETRKDSGFESLDGKEELLADARFWGLEAHFGFRVSMGNMGALRRFDDGMRVGIADGSSSDKFRRVATILKE